MLASRYENLALRLLNIRRLITDYSTGVQLSPGDVIGINRTVYEHYGIYIGNNRVIHFTSMDSDTSAASNAIMETGMSHFMRGQSELFVLDVERLVKEKQIFQLLLVQEGKQYRFYDAEETVARAQSRLGQRNYDLLFNNCEHFAMWCRSGVPEMNQLFYQTEKYKRYVTYVEHIANLAREQDERIRRNETQLRDDDRIIEENRNRLEALLTEAEALAGQQLGTLREADEVSAAGSKLEARMDDVLRRYGV